MKTRTVREPEKSDGAHLAWVLGLLLAAALILAPLVWLFAPAPANAVVTSGYYVLSTISRGYDTWTVSACSLYVVGGWDGSTLATLDSARAYTTYMVDPHDLADANQRDTLARWAILTPAVLDQDYNPVIYFVWYLSNGQTIRDDKPIIHMISYADYLRTAVDAVAVVDYNEMDSVLSATHGPGLWGSSGGTGVNVVRIYVRDTVGGVNVSNMPILVYATDATTIEGWGITSVTGYFDFSLNDGTYLARVSTPPFYLMATANDTIVVSGATQDTAEIYSYTIAPAAPGLTQVQFVFYDGIGSPIKNAIVRYQLETKAATNYHMRDSSTVIDPSKIFEVRSNVSGVAIINVTPNDSILTTGGKPNETKWRVKAYTPDGLVPLLGTDGVAIFVKASATALAYPQDF